MTIEAYLSIGSAASAFFSAALWVIAARSGVLHEPKPDKDGWFPASISVDGDDFIETAKKQGEWNRWAAYAAALAAALQGCSVLFPLFIEWAK